MSAQWTEIHKYRAYYKSPVAWCLLYEGLSLSALKARDLMFSLLAFKMDLTFFTEKEMSIVVEEYC